MSIPTFTRNLLLPSSGWVNLFHAVAEVICVNHMWIWRQYVRPKRRTPYYTSHKPIKDNPISKFENSFFRNVSGSYLCTSTLAESEVNRWLNPIIVWVIKSRRMVWARHMAQMGEMINEYRILLGKPEGKRPLQDLGVDERMILKWIQKK